MITPDFTGQYYRDTTTGAIWKSNSTTPGDWSLVIQDMQVVWTPSNVKLGELIGFFAYVDLGLSGTLSFDQVTSLNGFDIEGQTSLTGLSWPNLTSIDPSNLTQGYLNGSNNASLVTLSAPLLSVVGGGVSIFNDAALTSIDLSALSAVGSDLSITTDSLLAGLSLPSLTSVGNNLTFTDNPLMVSFTADSLSSVGGQIQGTNSASLATVSFASLLPTNGKLITFTGCNLSSASVNHILARAVASVGYVSGGIDLSGGTSLGPTGQGIIDKATLNGRQAGLAVTN